MIREGIYPPDPLRPIETVDQDLVDVLPEIRVIRNADEIEF
jgi:hypothetical protein